MSTDTRSTRLQRICFYLSAFHSFVGFSTFVYAMVIFTRARTGSDPATGFLYFLLTSPLVLFGMYAGTIADRRSRTAVLVTAQSLCAAVAFGVGLLATTPLDVGHVPALLAALAFGIAFTFVPPARFAMLGNLLPRERVERGTIALAMLNVVGFGLGPALVGFLRERHGWVVVFGGIAAIWTLGALLLVPVAGRSSHSPAATGESSWRQMLEGFQLLRSDALLWQLCSLTFLAGIFVLGPHQVLIPAYAADGLGLSESGRGAFMSVFGLGLLLGGALAIPLREIPRRGSLLLGMSLVVGFLLAALPSAPDAPRAALVFGLVGVAGGAMSSLLPATMQSSAPEASRGRVMSAYSSVYGGAPAFGGVLAGGLSSYLGVARSLEVMGLAAATCTILVAFGSSTVRMHRVETTRTPESA